MMFRTLHKADLDTFRPNVFSTTEGVEHVFDENKYNQYVLIDDENPEKEGETLAIICFQETEPRIWGGFMLISRVFTKRHARALKAFIDIKAKELNAEQLWTLSERHPILSKWHEILGMQKIGENVVNNTECDMWSRQWV